MVYGRCQYCGHEGSPLRHNGVFYCENSHCEEGPRAFTACISCGEDDDGCEVLICEACLASWDHACMMFEAGWPGDARLHGTPWLCPADRRGVLQCGWRAQCRFEQYSLWKPYFTGWTVCTSWGLSIKERVLGEVCALLLDAVRIGIPFDVKFWLFDDPCVVVNGLEEGVGLHHDHIEYVGGGSIYHEEDSSAWVEGVTAFIKRHQVTTLRQTDVDEVRAIPWMKSRVRGEPVLCGGWP